MMHPSRVAFLDRAQRDVGEQRIEVTMSSIRICQLVICVSLSFNPSRLNRPEKSTIPKGNLLGHLFLHLLRHDF